MSKTKKFWIGFFTFLPILGFIGYFVFFFAMFFNIAQSGTLEGSEPENISAFFGGFAFVFASLLITALSGIGIMIYDIVHVVNNKKFTENNRLMWILILVLTSGIGSIIYFFVEIMPTYNEEITSNA
jgi:hypothetical protein